ncbi:MAG TPA: M23 family metallopeptidase [Longimicrobiaceae bacterium]|jgi:murein DD-endopeptidase MepM/ murein hydrolase activator NlpD
MLHHTAPSAGARRHVRRALLAAALALAAAPAHAQLALAAPLPPLAARAEAPAPALLIPVAGVEAGQLRDSYHAGREGGREHQAIDIHAPRGTPVVAADDGTILRLHTGSRGGITVSQLGRDGHTRYYYAHLERYAQGLEEGRTVRRGDVIGYVGDTGNAAPGDFHLHFSISVLDDARRWWEGAAVNPFPLLGARAGQPFGLAPRANAAPATLR